MPVENMEEEGLKKIPDLRISQWKFELESVDRLKNDAATKDNIMKAIKEHKMAPLYQIYAKDLGWTIDKAMLDSMKEDNAKTLAELDVSIKDAEENLGESELREALLKKAEFFAVIGDKKNALEAIRKTNEKTVGLGNRMDLVFLQIRIGLFFMDHEVIKSNIDKAREMLEEGGDWDRRNRLKVYEGLYAMSVRDFKKAANLFLDGVSTFTSYELMDYVKFVEYTVHISMLALDRSDLHGKVIKGSEILEVLHQIPEVNKYLFSLYNCQYAAFFQCLSKVEGVLKEDRYMAPHYAFYVREMKIKAYAQLLESYRSLTLKYMADAFGVTEEYMDSELCRFIASGRLHAKIDKVGGIVITNRPDVKNAQYQNCIKQGDLLLNRVQKLSRNISSHLIMDRPAFEDAEGHFGRPEILVANSVHGKLDALHPYHPLEKSEANFHKNRDEAEMDMLRRTFGIGFPLKLQMERKAVSQVGHLSCITTATKPSLDALLGTDATIGFDDILGKPENFENMTALPFNMIEKQMKLM